MNADELRAIINSDFKLWEAADTENETPTTVTKVIDLPYNIGRTEVTLEGLDDANKRRQALEGFGQYIRDRIEDAVGDESISARAQQKAARDGYEDGGLVNVGRPYPGGPGGEVAVKATEVFDPEAVASLDELVSGPEAMAGRATRIRTTIRQLKEDLDALRRELRGLDAYLGAINASQNQKTPGDDPALESEAEDEEA